MDTRTGYDHLLSDGDNTPKVADFRSRVRKVIDESVAPLMANSEQSGRFPCEAVAALGTEGVFIERWHSGPHGDLGRSVVLADEMGYAGLGGIGVGISLHLEAATSLLVRFARTEHAAAVRDSALRGTAVGCVATSEEYVGSNLSATQTRLTPTEDGGWRVNGAKWFVSPGAAADFAIVLCASERGPALVLVPGEHLEVVKRLDTSGLRGLETSRLAMDVTVGDDAVLARPGMGMSALSWGLMHERLAIAAQVLGGLDLAITLALTHACARKQFGTRLFDHQALRLRLAELHAQVQLSRRGLYATAASLQSGGADLREAAAAKVTIARLGEHVVSECMHLFGGMGYLEDETPLARLWRDLRIGRLGAGSDEMMWEIVASGMHPDEEVYRSWVSG